MTSIMKYVNDAKHWLNQNECDAFRDFSEGVETMENQHHLGAVASITEMLYFATHQE